MQRTHRALIVTPNRNEKGNGMNNSTSLALSPEQFIFAYENALKTTSLKIAEAFRKRHDHVLRDIEKIISQVSDIFGKTNFGVSEIVNSKDESL